MMNGFAAVLAGAAFGAAAWAPAAALPASATFDFTTGGFAESGFSRTVGGVTVTVTGRTVSAGLSGSALAAPVTVSAAPLKRWSEGLGIQPPHDDFHGVDGGDNGEHDEFVQFSFNVPVRLVGVTFGFFNTGTTKDMFRVITDVNGGGINSGDAISDLLTINNSVYGDQIGETLPSIFSTLLGVGATRNADSWKLKAITVSPVPLPATAVLLGAGVLCLVGLRRRAARP